MASTAARPLGESSSGAATFSYAQAAKGAKATTASTVHSSQATSGANTPSKESNPLADTPSGSVNGATVSEVDRSAKINGDNTSRVASAGPEAENKAGSLGVSGPSSPSFGTASTATLPKEDMSSSLPNLSFDSPWDRPHQNGTSHEKTPEGSERKKGKKGKKDKTAEKEPEVEKEEVKPEILVAAPLPAVNPWAIRREAQAAKVKVSPPTTDAPQFPDSNTNGAPLGSVTKSSENKKKGKSGVEEPEKSVHAVQKENQTTKSQKKGEANARNKEDSNGKRPARGARALEKEEKAAASQLPPPVEDAISWPTPETALEEEKRRAQEKVEKEDKEENAPNKPRSKDKWVTVPYVPSVNFSTPLPSRGGRGGRGGNRGGRDGSGRSGHGPNGSVSGDKAFASTTTANNVGNEGRERGRDNSSNNRAASLPPNSSKRASGEDQRKASTSTMEKPKQEPSGPPKNDNNATRDHRRSSVVPQIDSSLSSQAPNPASTFSKSETPNGSSVDPQAQLKTGGPDRRTDQNGRNDYPKDANGNTTNRERTDGRSERGGRGGGFRGRGGHNNFPTSQPHPQHIYTNGGHPPQPPNGYGLRQNSGPYSPPIQQQQYGGPYAANGAMRGGRNSMPPPSRSQSIPNNGNIYTQFSPNMGSRPQQMAPLQTTGTVFDYPSVGSMSAVPYNPYVDQYSTLSMVTMQLEYYFSIDNLCKDIFLRRHMDSQGFVVLTFIAGFKRIQTLTQDFYLVRFACQESDIIEIIQAEDGVERVRRRDGWEQWTLNKEDRDPLAQNDGPTHHYPLPSSQRPQSMMPGMMPQPQAPMSAPAFSPNGAEQSFQPFPMSSMNVAGVETAAFQQTESPLSAAVPDFAPQTHSNGVAAESDFAALEAEISFTDDQVEHLMLVWRDAEDGESRAPSLFQGASSRTFSNGSIDVRSIAEEMLGIEKRQGRTLTNGTTSSSEM